MNDPFQQFGFLPHICNARCPRCGSGCILRLTAPFRGGFVRDRRPDHFHNTPVGEGHSWNSSEQIRDIHGVLFV